MEDNNNFVKTSADAPEHIFLTAEEITTILSSLDNIWAQFAIHPKIKELTNKNRKVTKIELMRFIENFNNSMKQFKERMVLLNPNHNANNSHISEIALYDLLSLRAISKDYKICYELFDFFFDDEIIISDHDKINFTIAFIEKIGINEFTTIFKKFHFNSDYAINDFYELYLNDKTLFGVFLEKVLIHPHSLNVLRDWANSYQCTEDLIKNINKDDIEELIKQLEIVAVEESSKNIARNSADIKKSLKRMRDSDPSESDDIIIDISDEDTDRGEYRSEDETTHPESEAIIIDPKVHGDYEADFQSSSFNHS